MDHLYRNRNSPHHPHRALAEPESVPPSRAPGYGVQFAGTSTQGSTSTDDVVFLIGKRRQAYHVRAESLIRGSAYFRNLLQQGNAVRAQTGGPPVLPSPLVLDCEEAIFESLLLLMRYGTLEALPTLSAAEAYQLKQEANFYGISFVEPASATPRHSSSADSGSDVSSTTSSSSGSPKSTMDISPPPTPCAGKGRRQLHAGVRVSCTTPRRGLAELQEFPLDLADPTRLVLISYLDADRAAKFYRCACSTSGSGATQWALNFHHRHAFCTACGAAPPTSMSAKHFADMFMAAAAYYSAEQGGAGAVVSEKWRVSSDSTCLLRFVSSAGDGPDACGCERADLQKGSPQATIWAANCFYSHAFCTRCSEAAKGPVLLSVMLALRYSGGNRGSRSARSAFTPPANSQ